MNSKKITYLQISQERKAKEYKNKLEKAIILVLNKKKQVWIKDNHRLALNIEKLNKISKKIDNERLSAIVKMYIEL